MRKLIKTAGLVLVLATLLSMLFGSLPIRTVLASPISIYSINPISGFVGDTIRVNGTIDTPDGNFTIRWNNSSSIISGTATGLNVNKLFVVPQTAGSPSGRNITVELIDAATNASAVANFTLYTRFDLQVGTPAAPKQFQEGNSTNITVSVTGGASNTVYTANITVKDPANQNQFSIAQLSNTTTTGSGSGVKAYPSSFAGASTNHTGNYAVSSNLTTGSKEFFVGLTDKSVYRLKETVLIQATGYKPSEVINADVKFGAVTTASFSNRTADSGGKVSISWAIPANSTPGNYLVTLSNTTNPGTVKTPKDSQAFEVLGVICQILTKNLAGEGIKGITVEVYNSTTPNILYYSGASNVTGWTRFNLAAGNYTFRAYWKAVEVGIPRLSNQSILTDTMLDFSVQLTDLQAFVRDINGGVPLVGLGLSYNYTTRTNLTKSETASMITDETGMSKISNLFTNLSYVLRGSRYGLSLPGLPLPNKTLAVPLNIVTVVLPTYTAVVSLLDAKDTAVSGIRIAAYEWSSGFTDPLVMETSSNGKASLSLTFGKYHLRAFGDSLVLNDTDLDLIENNLNFTFSLQVLNVDITVSVRDYFGQPISNANVTVEHRVGNDYVLAYSKFTGSDGSATFESVVGGDSRVSVYAGGNLVGTETQFVSGAQNAVQFDVAEYVSVFGSVISTGLFAFVLFLIVMVVVVILILSRKRLMKVLRRGKS